MRWGWEKKKPIENLVEFYDIEAENTENKRYQPKAGRVHNLMGQKKKSWVGRGKDA